MSAETAPTTVDDALLAAIDPVSAARDLVARSALRDGPVGQVGLELEFHLVDLSAPGRRPSWADVQALVGDLPVMPSGGSVTVEPGGQLELSTPPAPDVVAAVTALRADRATIRAALAPAGFGTAPLGTDPARPLHRVNPGARYVAMERHLTALGQGDAGRAMMAGTAALQVNLDAGPQSGWAGRLHLVAELAPVLVAVSACSPLLAGRRSGWRSMRQQAWQGIDAARTAPVPVSAHPGEAWADYALAAPVMMRSDRFDPVTDRVPFAGWLEGRAPFGRPPTTADLELHLTTLFPPVRPRGYLELRFLDAVPDRWWPALVALVTTLVDDEVAADQAADACAGLRGHWDTAARTGLDDPHLLAAAHACLDIAVRRCPPALRSEVEAYAELVAGGRTPGDLLLQRAEATDPLTVLTEEARA